MRAGSSLSRWLVVMKTRRSSEDATPSNVFRRPLNVTWNMNLLREKVLSRGVIHTPILPSHLFQPKKRGFTFAHYTFSTIRKLSLHFDWKHNKGHGEVHLFFCQSCEMLTKYAQSSFLILGTLNEVISNDSIKRIAKPNRFFFWQLDKVGPAFSSSYPKNTGHWKPKTCIHSWDIIYSRGRFWNKTELYLMVFFYSKVFFGGFQRNSKKIF